MSKFLSALFLALFATGCASKRPDYLKPRLQGTYSAVTATVNGRDLPPEMVNQLRLTLTDHAYKTERGREVLFDSTYLIDTTVKPNQINMLGTEGPAAGKEALGIYSLNGDYLRICYVMPGLPRPKVFGSPPGSNVTYVVWRRAPIR